MTSTPVIVEVRTNLGLVDGVQDLGAALRAAGIDAAIRADRTVTVEAAPFDAARDHPSRLLNADAMAELALRQADVVGEFVDAGRFTVVLGGDDSTLFGTLLALRRRGRYGLVFLDAHYDFYPPAESPTGEASDSDLYLAMGYGPDVIADLDGRRPLVRGADVVVIGHRDPQEAEIEPRVLATGAAVVTLDEVRRVGVADVARGALDRMRSNGVDGFVVHVDADVLTDELMPAVDYRVAGGLGRDEFVDLVSPLLVDELAVAIEVTIYNPRLDPTGDAARTLAGCLAEVVDSRRGVGLGG